MMAGDGEANASGANVGQANAGEASTGETERLRARVAELERELAALRSAPGGVDEGLRTRVSLLEAVLDSCPVYIYAKDVDGRFLLANQSMATLLQKPMQGIVGRTDHDLFPKEHADLYRSYDLRVLEAGPMTNEDTVEIDGRVQCMVTAKFPVRDADGKTYAVCSVTTDVTKLKEAEEENRRLQAEMLRIHVESLRALSTPLLPIAKGVVLMPLLGHLDEGRARDALEKLLMDVSSLRASIVILDITGMLTVDANVADTLLRATRAVKLLGASVVLTGVQPATARTVMDLGVELSGVKVLNTLQSGIAYALSRS
jgi:PAS domain S-box-containing protein